MSFDGRTRMGDKFERETEDIFRRIGFSTKRNIFGKDLNGRRFEQDVLAEKGNFRIVVQCKDYSKFPTNSLYEVMDKLREDGEKFNADRLVLIITGNNKKIDDKMIKFARNKEIFLWNENYWRKIQNMDLIPLAEEIGRNLEIKDILKYIEEKEKKQIARIKEALKELKNPKLKDEIYSDLEKIKFSDETKKEIGINKIENKILIYKQSDLEHETKNRVEDIEMEELFNSINNKNFSFDRKYKIFKKIQEEVDLSESSNRTLNFEKIKTYIDKQEKDIKNQLLRTKIIKFFVGLGISTIIFIILWRILI